MAYRYYYGQNEHPVASFIHPIAQALFGIQERRRRDKQQKKQDALAQLQMMLSAPLGMFGGTQMARSFQQAGMPAPETSYLEQMQEQAKETEKAAKLKRKAEGKAARYLKRWGWDEISPDMLQSPVFGQLVGLMTALGEMEEKRAKGLREARELSLKERESASQQALDQARIELYRAQAREALRPSLGGVGQVDTPIDVASAARKLAEYLVEGTIDPITGFPIEGAPSREALYQKALQMISRGNQPVNVQPLIDATLQAPVLKQTFNKYLFDQWLSELK